MSTAIYIAALLLASAIHPEGDWVEGADWIGKLFAMFIVYDLLNLRTSK